MTLPEQIPVLVAAGVAGGRATDAAQSPEAVELMVQALRNGAEQSGAKALLPEADAILVPKGSWGYRDPGRIIAERVGARRAHTTLAEIGILQQTLINTACRAIASGRRQVVLIAGGEARYRARNFPDAAETVQAETLQPDTLLKPEQQLWEDLELQRGLLLPVQCYAVMENALRHARGHGIAQQRDEIAHLWSACSETAHNNPHSWNPCVTPAEEIATVTERNPMMAFPYTRNHCSQWTVDQAAGLILCSVERARALGIAEEQWVYPLASAESNHMSHLSRRERMDCCPAFGLVVRNALAAAHIDLNDISHIDLYSCFPVALRIQMREMQLAQTRPLTITGGMCFSGGPLNNYVLQASCRLVELLRANPGSTGLINCVSGLLHKQACALWSTTPPRHGFHYSELSAEAQRATATRLLQAQWQGQGRIASYTVCHQKGLPQQAIAICDIDDGARTIAINNNATLMDAMMREEYCGQPVHITRDGNFSA